MKGWHYDVRHGYGRTGARAALCLGLVFGLAGLASAQDQPPAPSFEGQGGDCGTIHYAPAKLMTCAHGKCWWHEADQGNAYLFSDPVFCTGAHCPAGTIGPKGLRQ